MSQLLGTVIAAEITSGDTANTWSLGNLNFFQGGHKTAATIADRDAITPERRLEGMSCWVIATAQMFRLIGGTANSNWALDSGGGGGNGTVDVSARAGADFAIYLASQGTNGVNQVYPIAVAGTAVANLNTVWIGTLNSIVAGISAGNNDPSARAGVGQVAFIANSGTSGANFGIYLASQGTNGVNQVYPIAVAGTTVANLDAAWIGTINTTLALDQIWIGTINTALGNVSGATGRAIALCAGFTPLATGADTAEVVVPFASDGTTVITWNVKRIELRVGVAGGAPSVLIEKSTVSGIFTPTSVGTVTLSSGAYEGSVTTALGTVDSGDKLRFNPQTLATASNWTVIVELSV